MGNEKIGFTGINYHVCLYCSHVMRGMQRDDYKDGCGLQETDGKYAGVRDIDYKGCDQFNSSGLPAHPIVLETLIRANPKCSTIPSDPKATETSWDFEDKIKKHLPVVNFVSCTKIR